MKSQESLSDLQLEIMHVLWERGQASVADVHGDLAGQRELAYTTVATLLRRLEERGAVSHHEEGRQYIYKPQLARESVTDSMLEGLVQRLFGGDPAALVSHLMREDKLADRDLARIRALLDQGEDHHE